jgi:hypothetical protein
MIRLKWNDTKCAKLPKSNVNRAWWNTKSDREGKPQVWMLILKQLLTWLIYSKKKCAYVLVTVE